MVLNGRAVVHCSGVRCEGSLSVFVIFALILMLLVKCSVAQCSVWHHYGVCDSRSSGTAAAPLCPLTAIRRIYTSTVNMP